MVTHLKLSIRRASNNLGISVLAILVLTLGLSIAVSMFALANAILWSKPDIGTEGKLIYMTWRDDNRPDARIFMDIVDYQALKKSSDDFEYLSAYIRGNESFYNPEGDDAARRYRSARVDRDFFKMVKIKAFMGRVFSDADHASNSKNCLISYEVWQEKYASDSKIIGKTATIQGEVYRIIGVMPENFGFPAAFDIWRVSNFDTAKSRTKEKQPAISAIGILKRGKSIEEVKARLQPAIAVLKETYPKANVNKNHLMVKNINHDFGGNQAKALLMTLLISALLVLLVACTNVSNLILAKLSERQAEFAIKRSLGASRLDIFLSIVVDVMILSVLALASSLLLSAWICRIVWARFSNEGMPSWWHMHIDANVMIFAVIMMLFSLAVACFFPAYRAIKGNINASLKDDSRTSSSLFVGIFSKFLIGVQISISLALVISSLSFGSAVNFIKNIDIPYDPNDILNVHLSANYQIGYKSNQSVKNFYDSIYQNVTSIPNVKSVAFTRSYGGSFPRRSDFDIESRESLPEGESLNAGIDIVSHNLLQMYDFEPSSGRFFTATDTLGSERVAVVNQAFAHQHFRGENPIGKRLRIKEIKPWWDAKSADEASDDPYIKIIGIIRNLNPRVIDNSSGMPLSIVYLPLNQNLTRNMSMLVTSSGNVKDHIRQIKKAVRDENRSMPINAEIATVGEEMDSGNAIFSILVSIVHSFGFTSLFMASVGLYGLISFTVNQRKREFGIRMTVGATAGALVNFMFKKSRIELIAGFILGLAMGIFLSRAVLKTLGVIFPVDYISIFLAFLLVISLAGLSILIPSYRASRVKPSVALRCE